MSDQAGSSDTSASTELKAGHAPATKVGGMRVGAPRPRHTSHGDEKNAGDDVEGGQESSGDTKEGGADKATSDDAADNEQGSGAVANRAAGEMVSGTFVPIKEAFPTEAVKHIHDKPGTHPKHEFHTNQKHDDQRYINQPRKQ
ncbi:hypothetical protein I4U23_002461 [Adineta vaga]|nr:hypothetical protein I4U23_002461 [Adineta vaga]